MIAAVLAALVLAGSPTTRQQAAQSRAAALIATARAQLEAPNPDAAAVLLERALDPASSATTAEQTRGWVLYGIAQLMNDNAGAARAAFRQALQRDAALRVDSLAFFHDALEREFNAERGSGGSTVTRFSVSFVTPRDTVVPSDGRFPITVTATARARVITTIAAIDSPQAVVWADTQMAGVSSPTWNLRTPGGAAVRSGRYTLRVVATDSLGEVAPPIERQLRLSRVYEDAATAPGTPMSFLPDERRLRGGNPLWVVGGAAVAGVTLNRMGCIQTGTWMCRHKNATTGIMITAVFGVPLASVTVALRGYHGVDLPDNIQRNREIAATNAQHRALASIRDAHGRGTDVVPAPPPPVPQTHKSGYWLLGGALAGHAALMVVLRTDHQRGCGGGGSNTPCTLTRWALPAVAAGPLLGAVLYRWGPRRMRRESTEQYRHALQEHAEMLRLIAEANARARTAPIRIRVEETFR